MILLPLSDIFILCILRMTSSGNLFSRLLWCCKCILSRILIWRNHQMILCQSVPPVNTCPPMPTSHARLRVYHPFQSQRLNDACRFILPYVQRFTLCLKSSFVQWPDFSYPLKNIMFECFIY